MDEVRTRILVTGAGGFVGRAIVARLASNRHRIVAVGRTQPAVSAAVEALAIGDLAGADWSTILDNIDTVIHCAARAHVIRDEETDPLAAFRAVNRDATLTLASAAAAAGVRRFVFLSSIGVHGHETRGRAFAVSDVPQPYSPYAITKWEAEQGLADIAQNTGLEVVTVRPPLVIGRDPKGNLGNLVAAMRCGLPLPFGAVTKNRRDLVSIGTLADLVAHVINHPDAPGAPLLVSDGRPLSTRGVIERLATLHGLAIWLVPIPAALLGVPLRLIGRSSLAAQLLGDLEVDISETCRRLDWTPPRGVSA